MIRWVSAEDFHNRLDAGEWRRVAATFLFVALPLFFFLPTELGMLLAAGVVLKFVALALKNERFALGAALVLMFAGCSLVYSRLYSVGMTMSFVAMLVTMSVCKLLESRNRRDVHVLFLLQMLLMLAFLMYSQSIPMFLYLLFTLVISLRGLLRFEQLGRCGADVCHRPAVRRRDVFPFPARAAAVGHAAAGRCEDGSAGRDAYGRFVVAGAVKRDRLPRPLPRRLAPGFESALLARTGAVVFRRHSVASASGRSV